MIAVTFRSEVKYIEDMKPHLVDVAAEDFKRVVRLIDSALPALEEVKGKTQWSGEGKELLDRRLKEADMLLEALRYGYDKAGRALDDYVAEQNEAKRLVGEGIRVEVALGNLIRHIDDPGSEPMKTWDDLRGTQGVFDWIGEIGTGDDVDKVRAGADRLFNEASDYYSRAKRTETDARGLIVAALESARTRPARLPGQQRQRAGHHRRRARAAEGDLSGGQGPQRAPARRDHHGRIPGGRRPQHERCSRARR